MLVMSFLFFSLFFSPRVLRDPSTDRPETSPPDRNLRVFYNESPKITGGGHSPPKIGGQKHAKFRSIFDHFRLWSRISPERLKISIIGRRYKLWQFLLRLTKRSGELWSINGLELHVSLDPLKCTFLADYISARRGCCAPKILHALEIDQALIAHTQSGTGVPQKNSNRENLKFGLKFSVCIPITSGPVGVSPQNIFHTTCRQAGVITWV